MSLSLLHDRKLRSLILGRVAVAMNLKMDPEDSTPPSGLPEHCTQSTRAILFVCEGHKHVVGKRRPLLVIRFSPNSRWLWECMSMYVFVL